MAIHVHHLTGCAPAPLAHYLKALGILRLVAEQKDPAARLWWQDEHAVLATVLDEDALLRFFAEEYRPTPLVGPWNGGSGFYPGDNDKALKAISASKAARFGDYRDAIQLAKVTIDGKKERPSGDEKARFIARLRAKARGRLLAWIEAAIVLDEENSPAYPSLLGTGGNDGRLDFTNNFMQRLAEVFDLAADPALLAARGAAALRVSMMARCSEQVLGSNAIGQFFPGAAGGANASSGFSGESAVNSWDFILMMEGALLFTAALSRKVSVGGLPLASAPFALRGQSAGYGTAAAQEESARGEQWLPLWSQPATFADLVQVFKEGRVQLGRQAITRPMDAARAISRMGVARGINAFTRIAFLERNGQANLAIPLARWRVVPQPGRSLTDHAAHWIDRLVYKSRGEQAPASWKAAARRCEEALLSTCRDGRDPRNWEELLLAMGEAELLLARTPKQSREALLQPLSHLPGEWISVLPNTPELRLALALAGQVGVKDDQQGASASPCVPIF
jgi:CRISPR-associated protein Csx17